MCGLLRQRHRCFDRRRCRVSVSHSRNLCCWYVCSCPLCRKRLYRCRCHRRMPVCSESARHVVEDALFPSTEVVEFYNLSIGRLVVICKDAAVGIFSFLQVEFAVYPLLSLNHETVCLPFPFLDENGGQLKLNAVKFLLFPPSECKDVVVERTAAECGVKGKMTRQVGGDILNARTAAEVYA